MVRRWNFGNSWKVNRTNRMERVDNVWKLFPFRRCRQFSIIVDNEIADPNVRRHGSNFHGAWIFSSGPDRYRYGYSHTSITVHSSDERAHWLLSPAFIGWRSEFADPRKYQQLTCLDKGKKKTRGIFFFCFKAYSTLQYRPQSWL